MVARRDSPDSETWLLLLNAVGTADSLDKAVALIERSRAEGDGSEVYIITTDNYRFAERPPFFPDTH